MVFCTCAIVLQCILKRHTLSERTDVKQTIVTRTVCVSRPNMARTPAARAAVFQEWAESKIRHHAIGARLSSARSIHSQSVKTEHLLLQNEFILVRNNNHDHLVLF